MDNLTDVKNNVQQTLLWSKSYTTSKTKYCATSDFKLIDKTILYKTFKDEQFLVKRLLKINLSAHFIEIRLNYELSNVVKAPMNLIIKCF